MLITGRCISTLWALRSILNSTSRQQQKKKEEEDTFKKQEDEDGSKDQVQVDLAAEDGPAMIRKWCKYNCLDCTDSDGMTINEGKWRLSDCNLHETHIIMNIHNCHVRHIGEDLLDSHSKSSLMC
jgi:hypothetical protein